MLAAIVKRRLLHARKQFGCIFMTGAVGRKGGSEGTAPARASRAYSPAGVLAQVMVSPCVRHQAPVSSQAATDEGGPPGRATPRGQQQLLQAFFD